MINFFSLRIFFSSNVFDANFFVSFNKIIFVTFDVLLTIHSIKSWRNKVSVSSFRYKFLRMVLKIVTESISGEKTKMTFFILQRQNGIFFFTVFWHVTLRESDYDSKTTFPNSWPGKGFCLISTCQLINHDQRILPFLDPKYPITPNNKSVCIC